jgi:hypothetical protein
MPGAKSTGVIPTTEIPAADEVIDAIADIEVRRQQMEKEGGLVASCSAALRKLHELLDQEKDALQLRGPGTRHPQNVEAVTIEIEKVKGLTVIAGQSRAAGSAYPDRQKASWQSAHRNPARNKGRRTMGRAGGR